MVDKGEMKDSGRTGTNPDRNVYQALLRSRITGAIASARAAAAITHPGLKGQVLEILVSDLFVPLLPSDIGVGSGQIVECERGMLSSEVDIILYDKSILPPMLFSTRQGIFPIEAVLYAIEVKTTLTRRDLESAHANARALHDFRYLPAQRPAGQNPAPVERVRSVVFALNTDLSPGGTSEVQRYKDVYVEDKPYLRAVCVVDRGYWYEDGEKWLNHKTSGELGEVLAFIGGVTNTYRAVAHSRGSPSLGNYIIPNDLVGLELTASKPGGSVQLEIRPGSGSKKED